MPAVALTSVAPMRRVLTVVLLAVLAAACTNDGSPTVGPATSATDLPATTQPVEPGTAPATDGPSGTPAGVTVALTPGAVVRGGDPDGSGTAVIRLVPERAEVCYDLTVKGIGVATSAHLHRGAANEDGAVVLSFTPPDKSGKASNCAAGDSLLVEELQSAPSRFYVDLHNDDHPMGALRGQLANE